MATQGADISADFSVFPCDGVLAEHFERLGVTGYAAADADPDAPYLDVREIDLSALEPYVARPGTVSRNGCRSRRSNPVPSTRLSSAPARPGFRRVCSVLIRESGV